MQERVQEPSEPQECKRSKLGSKLGTASCWGLPKYELLEAIGSQGSRRYREDAAGAGAQRKKRKSIRNDRGHPIAEPGMTWPPRRRQACTKKTAGPRSKRGACRSGKLTEARLSADGHGMRLGKKRALLPVNPGAVASGRPRPIQMSSPNGRRLGDRARSLIAQGPGSLCAAASLSSGNLHIPDRNPGFSGTPLVEALVLDHR